MADGTLIFDTRIDNQGFDTGTSRLGSIAKKGFGAIAKSVGVLSTALTAAGGFAINLASDLEEVQNVVDVTFGEGAETINKWSKDAVEAFGLSELQAKQFNGTMGAMLKSMGLAEDAVLEMSPALAGLAGDLASFYNLDPKEAFDKLRAGISGETEPLKQLGINMSVANLEAFALSQGINKAYKEMTEAEKATLRYNYLMKVSADAQGDFARTSDSFANQQRVLQEQFKGLAADIGSKLLPAASKATEALVDMTKRMRTAFEKNGFEGVVEEFGNSLGEILSEIIKFLPKIVEIAGKIALSLVGVIVKNLPLFIKATLDAAAAVMKALAESLPELIPQIVEAVIGILVELISNAPQLLEMGLKIVEGIVKGVLSAIPLLLEGVATMLKALTGAIDPEIEKINGSVREAKAANDELSKSLSDTTTSIDDQVKSVEAQILLVDKWSKCLIELSQKTSLTNEEQAEWQTTLGMLESSIPGITNLVGDQVGVIEKGSKALSDYVKNWMETQKAEAYARAAADSMDKLVEAEINKTKIDAKLQEATAKASTEQEKMNKLLAEAKDKFNITAESAYDAVTQLQAFDKGTDIGLTTLISELTTTGAALGDAKTGVANLAAESERAGELITTASEPLGVYTDALESSTMAAEANKDALDGVSASASNAGETDLQAAGQTDEATQKMQEAFEKRVKYTQNAFDRIKSTVNISAKQMIADLQANQKLVTEWTTNLGILAQKGLDEGLLQALRDAGPEAAGTVAKLVKASDSELDKLSETFRAGSQVAIDSLKKEMGLPTTVNSGKEMIGKVAEGVDNSTELKTASVAVVKDAKVAMQEQVTKSNFGSVGNDIINGLSKGLSSNAYKVYAEAEKIAKKIEATIKEALIIRSPSKKMIKLSSYSVDGLTVGLEKNAYKPVLAMKDIATDVHTAAMPKVPISTFGKVLGASQTTDNRTATYNINIGKTEASPYEVMRAVKLRLEENIVYA